MVAGRPAPRDERIPRPGQGLEPAHRHPAAPARPQSHACERDRLVAERPSARGRLRRRTLLLWEPGADLRTALAGHTGGIGGVSWSPDGRRVASAGAYGAVRVWNPTAGTTEFTPVRVAVVNRFAGGTGPGWRGSGRPRPSRRRTGPARPGAAAAG
ncbi:WD40 repeat domain-containing protein [Dactylosporangium sp. NPDC049525]|uniref:WD40 repeat domain-containing protein n=1 Tax=Dactylosporangium sp. NPDC049525 TaxID=3154730 RepID=UPI00342B6DE0